MSALRGERMRWTIVFGLVAASLTVLSLSMTGCGDGFLCPPGTEEFDEGLVDVLWYQTNTDRRHACRLPDGLKHGPYEVRREDGSLKVKGAYDHGEPCGIWRTYDYEGNLVDREDHDRCRFFDL